MYGCARVLQGRWERMIKVVIIDDSALVRSVVSEILETDPEIKVIAMAQDPIFAMKYLEKEWPDVIVLDVEMPRMDGITFLRKIMDENPTPVIICSTLTEKGTKTTMQALAAGAVGIITKPKLGVRGFLQDSKITLIDTVRSAAHVKMKRVQNLSTKSVNISKEKETNKSFPPSLRDFTPREKNTADVILQRGLSGVSTDTEKIVAIGASTGGTQALEVVLKMLPIDSPGIVVVQHMPEHYTKAFAERLNGVCDVSIKEAEAGDSVERGKVLIAPGNRHTLLKRRGTKYYVDVVDGPLVNRHRPSVDVLFRSAAKESGKNALGIIMTGMGDDGSNGMVEMKAVGSPTIAQNEKTSIVFGMPKEAIKKNCVDKILPLENIAEAIIDFYSGS